MPRPDGPAAVEDGLLFDLLGPVQVRAAGTVVDVGPPQRRRLLIRLLLAGQHPIPVEQLHDDLWQGRPPRGAGSSIHAHVSRLRAVLEAGGPGSPLLVRDRLGYTLRVADPQLVSRRFETALDEARRALTLGRAAAAGEQLHRALGWWRGPALAEVADLAFAKAEAARLDEARLIARELRVTALLAAGDTAAAVPAARALTVEHPLRESGWEQLIRALYLGGRPAEALVQYERIRSALADELGTDPGPDLRRLHLAVLRHDDTAIAPATAPRRVTVRDERSRAAPRRGLPPVGREPAAGGEPWAGTAAPRDLPMVGRDRELAALIALIERARAGAPGWAVISGEWGVGKTMLAEVAAAAAGGAGWAVVASRTAGTHTAAGLLADLGVTPRPVSPAGVGYAAGVGNAAAVGHAAGSGGAVDFEAAAVALAHRLAGRPTVWLVDGLEQLDEGARALLGHLAVRLRGVPLAVLGTVRDPDAPPVDALTVLLTRCGATRIALPPLGPRDVDRLLAELGRRAPERGAVAGVSREAADLHARTGGNPFFLVQLLGQPQWWRPDARPPGAVTVLRAMLAGLPSETRAALRAMAPAGHRVSGVTLAEAAGVPLTELDRRLAAAVRAGLVRRVPLGDPAGHGYRFAVPLVRGLLTC